MHHVKPTRKTVWKSCGCVMILKASRVYASVPLYVEAVAERRGARMHPIERSGNRGAIGLTLCRTSDCRAQQPSIPPPVSKCRRDASSQIATAGNSNQDHAKHQI
jgi:hypothetical protein